MNFDEHMDREWLVITLVPGFIEVHTGVQFGTPTPIKTRVTTLAASGAWENQAFEDYEITEEMALVCRAFEVGREYQRNRKLRKRIDEACSAGWRTSNERTASKEAKLHLGEGI